MWTSTFIAKLLGPTFFVVGAAMLSKPEAYRAVLRELVGSGALMFLAGFLGLLGRVALLLTHNVWALDWRLGITLVGWANVVRAVVMIFWPEKIVSIAAKLIERKRDFAAGALLDLVIGAALSYFGYFA